MSLFESIADRRIREARVAGYFDDLPGKGRPIPDLDRERPPGWWASRAVKTERDKMRFEALTAELRSAMPSLWRLPAQDEVMTEVEELNDRIRAYNKATSFQPIDLLDPPVMLHRWRRVAGFVT